MRLVGVNYLSPSAMATLVSCERQWWWKYQAGIREGSSEPLAMGGGFAHALEFGLAAGLAEYHARRAPLDPVFGDPVEHDRLAWVAEATITEAYAGYQHRWPDADAGIEREVTFIVGIDKCDRLLQVRADGVGPHHIVEDKLRAGSSLQSAKLENEVRQGRQLTAEIYCVWRDTGELLPVSFRNVKKIDPRKVKVAGMLRSDIVHAIHLHFQQDGSFLEHRAERTLDQLAGFEDELRGLAKRADLLAKSKTPAGAKNTDVCHSYGRECPALAACQGVQSTADLLAEYVARSTPEPVSVA